MSARASLSVRTLRGLLDLFGDIEAVQGARLEPEAQHLRIELRRALASCERHQSLKSKSRRARGEKGAAKRKTTSKAYLVVVARAHGHCEVCGHTDGLQIDHFEGRARSESEETCWLLCWRCHDEKTANSPSARIWLECFIGHCEKHGYSAAAERARRRLDGMVKVREMEAAR